MRSQELWEQNREIARQCLVHPFVRGLRDGGLPTERYTRYIAQDAFYLDAFARAYAVGIARSPDRESMQTFVALMGGVFKEQELHEAVAAQRNIDLSNTRPLPATLSYTNFLLASAFQGSLGELLAALTPCMRLYNYLGQELAREDGADTYQEWVDSYANEEFGDHVTKIEKLLDSHATGTEREAGNYTTAMQLELAFFESAWKSPL